MSCAGLDFSVSADRIAAIPRCPHLLLDAQIIFVYVNDADHLDKLSVQLALKTLHSFYFPSPGVLLAACQFPSGLAVSTVPFCDFTPHSWSRFTVRRV